MSKLLDELASEFCDGLPLCADDGSRHIKECAATRAKAALLAFGNAVKERAAGEAGTYQDPEQVSTLVAAIRSIDVGEI